MPISGMKQGSGKSRIAGRAFACAGTALAVGALAAPGASADPAVEEYTLDIPQASGTQHLPPGAAASGIAAGGSSTAAPPGAGGSGSTEGKGSLVQDVAKKPELGAPQTGKDDYEGPAALGTAGRGVPEIVADTVDESEGGAPALLAALGAIAAAGVWVGLRRRRSNLRTSS
jgi:hypothetical protein